MRKHSDKRKHDAAAGLPADARGSAVTESKGQGAVAERRQIGRFIRFGTIGFYALCFAVILSAIMGGWPFRRVSTEQVSAPAAVAEATGDAPELALAVVLTAVPASVVPDATALPTATAPASATLQPTPTLAPSDTATATPTATATGTATARPTRQPTKTKVPIVPAVAATNAPANTKVAATSAPIATKVPVPTALPTVTPVPTEDINALTIDELGDRGAMACGGFGWAKSFGCKNAAEGRRWFELVANAGDAAGWTMIGHIYCGPRWGSENRCSDAANARVYFERGAAGGHFDALGWLGDTYCGPGWNFEGIKCADKDGAIAYYQKAAAAGITDVMIHLGNIACGDSWQLDSVLHCLDQAGGKLWFEKSALAGNGNGMALLGKLYWMYYEDEKACSWFRKALASDTIGDISRQTVTRWLLSCPK